MVYIICGIFLGYCKFNYWILLFFAVFRGKFNIIGIYLGYILYWNILSLFIPEWDLDPEFNLGFPELNSGYSLREVTTQGMFS